MSANSLLMANVRHQAIRWHLLSAINLSRPQGMYTQGLLPIIQSVYPDATENEIRRELDYLAERRLLKIAKDGFDRWMVEMMRYGIDVVEYTVECDPGISRPRLTRD